MEDVETYTRRKWGFRYLVYGPHPDIPGEYVYAGKGADTLEEARKEASKLCRPALDFYVFDGDRDHPDSKEV